MIFDHLDLFRISDFDFRICKFISTWRALRLRASRLLPDFVIQDSTENFKFFWLAFPQNFTSAHKHFREKQVLREGNLNIASLTL